MMIPSCRGLTLTEALALFEKEGVPFETEDVTPARGTGPEDVLRVIRVRERDGKALITVGRFPPEIK